MPQSPSPGTWWNPEPSYRSVAAQEHFGGRGPGMDPPILLLKSHVWHQTLRLRQGHNSTAQAHKASP